MHKKSEKCAVVTEIYVSVKRFCCECVFSALTTNLIGTIGIGDGGNEIGMGKVRDQVTKHIPYGKEIACRVTADQLITAGVSNWGGYALATALYMLYNCPVHSRYVRRGTGKFEPLPLDGFVNANHKVWTCCF